MAYIVFARKYRPQHFDDISGQEHVTTTLKNALLQGRVGHAYLFTGSRGVGKTTVARLFAKALNCEKAPTADPCGKCDSCKEIAQGASLDILEIDGASNRGIDEIRNLREHVKFTPSKGRFKIYIIDEVHMLTPEAFNALLKTLEEPPAHAKFIFATTHVHKVPATILSRCQRFDFRRLAAADILANMKKIVKNEHLSIQDEALALIARHADGSMRDGQVMLDQIMSFAGSEVRADDVVRALGIVSEEMLFALSAFIKKRDTLGALTLIDRAVGEGRDIVQVTTSLVEHFRNIALAKIGQDAGQLFDAGGDRAKAYKAEASQFSIEEILYIMYTLSNTIDLARRSEMQRLPLEMAFIKLTQLGMPISLAELAHKVERMEALARGGGFASSEKVGYDEGVDKRPTQAPKDAVVNCEGQGVAAASGAVHPQKHISGARAEAIVRVWGQIIGDVRQKKISIASYLEEATIIGLDSGVLTLSFPSGASFHKEMLEMAENKKIVTDAIKAAANIDVKIDLVLSDFKKNGDNKVSPRPAAMSGSDDPMFEQGDGDDVSPIVKSALEIFNGEIANGKPKKQDE